MNISGINRESMTDGEGVRVSLFVSGCSFHCKGCFNGETWSFTHGKPFDSEALGILKEALSKPYIAGLTILGGEPLAEQNAPLVSTLCEWFHREFPDKTLWIYTGYTWDEVLGRVDPSWHFAKHVVYSADVVVDGRFVESERDITLKWRGSRNQRVIDVKKTLETGKVVLWCD